MFWTDLQYIRNETKRFHTFVANRVAEIRDVTNVNQWRHCPGKLNPADDASRRLRTQKLSTQHRWWRGPEFLWQSEECWPDAKVGDIPDDDPEIRMEVRIHQINVASNVSGVSIKFLSSDQGFQKMVECCGSWITLQRRTAWLVRCCHWIAAGRKSCSRGTLTQEELDQATQLIIRVVQGEYFVREVEDLKASKEVKTSSRIARVRPILVNGILRVGGRLEEAVTLSFDEKYPIILPKRHHISCLMVRHCHERLTHAGREETLAETRKVLDHCGKKPNEEDDSKLFQMSSIECKANEPSDASLAQVPTRALQATLYVLWRLFLGAPQQSDGDVCSRA